MQIFNLFHFFSFVVLCICKLHACIIHGILVNPAQHFLSFMVMWYGVLIVMLLSCNFHFFCASCVYVTWILSLYSLCTLLILIFLFPGVMYYHACILYMILVKPAQHFLCFMAMWYGAECRYELWYVCFILKVCPLLCLPWVWSCSNHLGYIHVFLAFMDMVLHASCICFYLPCIW